MTPFSISRLPRIVFGAGGFDQIPALVAAYGTQVLLVTGARSFQQSAYWPRLMAAFKHLDLDFLHLKIGQEPSPALIDAAVRKYSSLGIEVVLAIGGGSVLDAAKAIAGLLPHGNSVMDHLEGVGKNIPYHGPATPFIAVPTTAGTGSEATKNAVLSVSGENGYKKSFRHECLIPEYAVIDPDLLITCPPAQIAANGMDALTQLIESYVSTQAHALTDALASDGIHKIKLGFLTCYEGGQSPLAAEGRDCMAYAALLSGITLAQVGLGAVHGLASPLGAFFPIPHGVVCGTLLAATTEVNIQALRARQPQHPALTKYARLGAILTGQEYQEQSAAWSALVQLLTAWTARFQLPRLSTYGVSEAHVDKIVAHARGNSMKTNPLELSDAELRAILLRCL